MLFNILSGEGRCPFQIFAGTFKFILKLQFVDIAVKIDGKNSSFSVPDVMDVQVESLTNPVTGQEQETKVQLPIGFIWKLAEAAKTKIMRITTQDKCVQYIVIEVHKRLVKGRPIVPLAALSLVESIFIF
jgi:hypothetical protein